METTQTVELLLDKFPKAARKAYRVPHITNNLVAVSELCDAGCTVYFHKHGVEMSSKERSLAEDGGTNVPDSGESHSLPRVARDSHPTQTQQNMTQAAAWSFRQKQIQFMNVKTRNN